MADGKDCGDDEKQLAFTPSDGLLVPEACDDAQHGESEAQGVDEPGTATFGNARFEMAAFEAVAHVDVEADEHPYDKPDPCVGR